jgi:hypothetical protein
MSPPPIPGNIPVIFLSWDIPLLGDSQPNAKKTGLIPSHSSISPQLNTALRGVGGRQLDP